MGSLLFANIPHHCNDQELRTWIEAKGIEVSGLTLIRDVVSGSSPSFARVHVSNSSVDGAAEVLNQQPFGNRRIYVRRGRSPLDD
jgi:hypothetical protein